MRWIDISMPLFEQMPCFPGDPEFSLRPVHSLARGDAYSVSAVALGSHAGTHVDPPNHFLPDGASIDRVDPDILNGPCRVLEVAGADSEIGPEVIEQIPAGTTRVLFRTRNSERWSRRLEFFPDYVSVGPAAADAIVARGIRLVGVDSLSVERDLTGRFPVHHRLLGHGTLIIEGLLLAGAPAGEYRLHALPLRLKGGDGGPARVYLTDL